MLLPVAVASFALSDAAFSERALARRAAGGDVAAFEELFHQHQGRIYALCLRMTADPARAEELTQEAFVRAWQKLDRFRGASAFGTWMHRLAANLVLSDLRSRGRWAKREVEADPESPELARASPAPRDGAGRRIDLERAIATLPAQARTVFVLHDVEGYRHREIAEIAGIAEGTSKAHLHRARQLLREALRS